MGKTGKIRCVVILLAIVAVHAVAAHAQAFDPLTLVQTIELPDVPRGAFTDHLCIDLKGQRLFTTMQAQKVVAVIDLQTRRVLHNIPVGNPHACEYREDLEQLYVSDGDSAKPGLKIFSGRDYRLIKSIDLTKGTDSMGYDPRSKYLYLVNGGERADMQHSIISIIDTSTSEHVGDIQAASKFLEDMDIDPTGSRLYITDEDANNLVVVDPKKRTTIATWPITKGGTVVAAAADGVHHRLFVACRTTDLNGSIVVIDTETGKELKALPIGGWLDYLAFDAQNGRLYAVCGVGYVYVYQQLSSDDYVLLGKAETGLLGKTGLLVPELHELFVSLPMMGWDPAKVLVFRVN